MSTKLAAERNLEQILSIVKIANAVCSDTITTLLLPVQDLYKPSDIKKIWDTTCDITKQIENLKLGIILKDASKCEQLVSLMKPQVIILEGNSDNSNSQLTQAFKLHLNRCRSNTEELNHTVSFGVSYRV